MEGLLILEKRSSNLFRDYNICYKGIDVTHYWDHWENFELWLMEKNKGFELDDYGLARFEYLNDIIEYVSLGINKDIDLFIVTNSKVIKKYKKFSFLGFDYGVIKYVSCDTYYFSSIINEVRPDGNSRFVKFVDKLNENYLLPSFELAKELHLERVRAFEENDVTAIETFVEPDWCQPIQVHLYKG